MTLKNASDQVCEHIAANSSVKTVLECLEKEIEQISKLIKDYISKHLDLKHKHDLLDSDNGISTVK